MNANPAWLRRYYGSNFDKFSPSVVMEGTRVAVLRIFKKEDVPSRFSTVAFVLVRKLGRVGSTPQKSLHEGMASQADLDRMTAVFQAEDEKL